MKDRLFAAIDIIGKVCTVIGGGRVAERKIKKLVDLGASVTAIAPEFTNTLDELKREGVISVRERCYEKGDLKGAFLAVIATDDDEANKNASDEAKELGILTNAAFDRRYGDIFFTATKDIGDYTLSAMGKDMSAKKSVDFLDEISNKYTGKEDE